MKKSNLIYVLLSFSFLWQSAVSQGLSDARRLGMAGSNYAIAEGTEFVGGNPATLAKQRDFNFELHLLSAHFMVKNNSYSLKDYDKYFTTGDSLTSQDIDNLFNHIPGDGMRLDGALGVKTFSIYARPFSLTLYGMGNAFVNLPKDPFELPFYGNTVKKEYHLDDLDGEAWGAAVVSFAIGFPITKYFSDKFDFVSVGIAPKYIFGLGYGKIETATGKLVTEDTYISVDGHLESKISEGGSGLGLDLGFLADYHKKWTFSLSFSNLIGGIKWKKNDSLRIASFKADSIRINDLDSLTTTETDTVLPIGNFSTGLPRAMIFSAAYQYRPNLVLTATWRQGLNKSLGNFTKPLLAVGAEYRPLSVFPLRMGMAFGGENGFALGLGAGINLKYWQLELGYLNHNFRWFRSARSVDIALTTQFRF